jgi:hypothetical protein
MGDVFVSYASDQRGSAGYVVSLLEVAGFKVWWDRSLQVSHNYSSAIQQALESCKCVVTLWTKAALASDWVLGEATYALQDRKLVALWMEDVRLPPPFNVTQSLDLRRWKGSPDDLNWFSVVRSVRSFVDPSGRTAVAQDDYVRAATARSGHLIHKLKAKDTTGRWAYYFVLIAPDREASFLQAIKGAGVMDLEDFGKVVASCYGEEPTAEIKAYLKTRYGFDV